MTSRQLCVFFLGLALLLFVFWLGGL